MLSTRQNLFQDKNQADFLALNNHLADVVSREEANESLGDVLKVIDDRLLGLDLALLDPLGQLDDSLAETGGPSVHQEPFHAKFLRENSSIIKVYSMHFKCTIIFKCKA